MILPQSVVCNLRLHTSSFNDSCQNTFLLQVSATKTPYNPIYYDYFLKAVSIQNVHVVGAAMTGSYKLGYFVSSKHG